MLVRGERQGPGFSAEVVWVRSFPSTPTTRQMEMRKLLPAQRELSGLGLFKATCLDASPGYDQESTHFLEFKMSAVHIDVPSLQHMFRLVPRKQSNL